MTHPYEESAASAHDVLNTITLPATTPANSAADVISTTRTSIAPPASLGADVRNMTDSENSAPGTTDGATAAKRKRSNSASPAPESKRSRSSSDSPRAVVGTATAGLVGETEHHKSATPSSEMETIEGREMEESGATSAVGVNATTSTPDNEGIINSSESGSQTPKMSEPATTSSTPENRATTSSDAASQDLPAAQGADVVGPATASAIPSQGVTTTEVTPPSDSAMTVNDSSSTHPRAANQTPPTSVVDVPEHPANAQMPTIPAAYTPSPGPAAQNTISYKGGFDAKLAASKAAYLEAKTSTAFTKEEIAARRAVYHAEKERKNKENRVLKNMEILKIKQEEYKKEDETAAMILEMKTEAWKTGNIIFMPTDNFFMKHMNPFIQKATNATAPDVVALLPDLAPVPSNDVGFKLTAAKPPTPGALGSEHDPVAGPITSIDSESRDVSDKVGSGDAVNVPPTSGDAHAKSPEPSTNTPVAHSDSETSTIATPTSADLDAETSGPSITTSAVQTDEDAPNDSDAKASPTSTDLDAENSGVSTTTSAVQTDDPGLSTTKSAAQTDKGEKSSDASFGDSGKVGNNSKSAANPSATSKGIDSKESDDSAKSTVASVDANSEGSENLVIASSAAAEPTLKPRANQHSAGTQTLVDPKEPGSSVGSTFASVDANSGGSKNMPTVPSPAAEVTPKPRVIYHSTATQTFHVSDNNATFKRIYGRDKKDSDMPRLAPSSQPKPTELKYGPSFYAPERTTTTQTETSGFQIMDHEYRAAFIRNAKVMGKANAGKIKPAGREQGYRIFSETRDNMVLHSQQIPPRIIIELEENGKTLKQAPTAPNLLYEPLPHGIWEHLQRVAAHNVTEDREDPATFSEHGDASDGHSDQFAIKTTFDETGPQPPKPTGRPEKRKAGTDETSAGTKKRKVNAGETSTDTTTRARREDTPLPPSTLRPPPISTTKKHNADADKTSAGIKKRKADNYETSTDTTKRARHEDAPLRPSIQRPPPMSSKKPKADDIGNKPASGPPKRPRQGATQNTTPSKPESSESTLVVNEPQGGLRYTKDRPHFGPSKPTHAPTTPDQGGKRKRGNDDGASQTPKRSRFEEMNKGRDGENALGNEDTGPAKRRKGKSG